jgi:CubicO group peptidase (beta-lactamase class C family)
MKTSFLHKTLSGVLIACSILFAALSVNQVQAEDAKTPHIATIKPAMDQFVKDHVIAGSVTLVAGPKEILHLEADGYCNLDTKTAMDVDQVFWIASMSKPICGAAIMILVDEDRIKLDDPVSKYIPEAKDLKLADGTPVVITIKHLLTHTSGLSEVGYKESNDKKTIAEIIPLYMSQKVNFVPGSKWVYCQSGINTASRIVEIASGMKYDEFLEKKIFKPLGMDDTTFYLSQTQNDRLARAYKFEKDKVTQVSNFLLNNRNPMSRDRLPMANGGLYSTAKDYLKFCQMLLNDGELNGTRVLSANAVKTFSTVQFPDVETGFTPGNGWGVGCCVVKKPQGPSEVLSVGSYGHGGAYGTQAWIDPVKKRIYILMVQRANFPNADASDVRIKFQQLASEGLKDEKPKSEAKPEEKKPEAVKPEEKKAEDKKSDEKKPDVKQAGDKKPEEKKADEKKPVEPSETN